MPLCCSQLPRGAPVDPREWRSLLHDVVMRTGLCRPPSGQEKQDAVSSRITPRVVLLVRESAILDSDLLEDIDGISRLGEGYVIRIMLVDAKQYDMA